MKDQRPAVSRSRTTPPASGEWEIKVLVFSRDVSRSQARQLLTEHAEYGRWELESVQLYLGGTRRVRLRRRVMRVQRTA